jgi:hypothetical protein
MLSFSAFLAEASNPNHMKNGMYDNRISDSLRDFVGHLMAPAYEPKEDNTFHNKDLKEAKGATAEDFAKPLARLPNGGIDMAKHPAVHQSDPVKHKEHVDRYYDLMKHGDEIASSQKMSPSKAIKTGFNNYMSNVGRSTNPVTQQNEVEDPRVTQRPQLKAAKEAVVGHFRKFGYKVASAPRFIAGNTKTEKNVEKGDITAGLALSPAKTANIGKHSACVKASTECEEGCLAYTTGQNAMLSNVNSKIARHHFIAGHPEHAARLIHSELLDHVDNVAKWNSAKKPGETPLIASYRPNMTTDYNHGQISKKMIDHVTEYAKNKGVKFQVRDYTKFANRLTEPRSNNYFLALSHTGSNHSESNDHEVSKALDQGHTVASVVRGDATHFYDHKTKRLYPIAEGDDDDQIEHRHATVGHVTQPDGTGRDAHTGKPTGVVSALRIKGSSTAAKEAAGDFENQTTTIHHPKHGAMRVVEINKPATKNVVK